MSQAASRGWRQHQAAAGRGAASAAVPSLDCRAGPAPRQVRDFLDSRSFVLRNQRRTNLLLGPVRNHLNGADSERRYVAQLRAHLDQVTVAPQRSGYDTAAGPRTPAEDRLRASLRT